MTFWILAPIMVAAALGILFVRKAVHAALLLAVVMISLAILYAVLEAPFLFVLMMVGRDSSDSVVEVIRGQRLAAALLGIGFAVLLVGAIYQINYLRCIGCGLCVEACPTRSLTMTNFYEMADDNRQDLIYTKEQLLAPLLPGMEQPPHPMRLGTNEQDYYVNGPQLARKNPETDPVGEQVR